MLKKNKKLKSQVEGLKMQFQLIFDEFSNEYQGFQFFIDKNILLALEINQENIDLKNHNTINIGNRRQEIKIMRKKKRMVFNKNQQEYKDLIKENSFELNIQKVENNLSFDTN